MPNGTSADVGIDLASDRASVTSFTPQECAHCRGQILPEQRWVREKIYELVPNDGPRYQRYHADLFGDEDLSCWEKHQLNQEDARVALRAA